jgi:DNA gyrase subunit A
MDVTEKEDLMITCKSGITIRMPVGQISELGRATQGVKLIRVDDEDEIAAISKIDEDDKVEENGVEGVDEANGDAEEGGAVEINN